MNIEQFRDYCLSFPDTHEGTPFESFFKHQHDPHSVLVYSVEDKMFCYFDLESFDMCTIKCDPDKIAELRKKFKGIGAPYNGNPKYWIGVKFNSDVPDSKLRELVRESYDLVVGGLSKKAREKVESVL